LFVNGLELFGGIIIIHGFNALLFCCQCCEFDTSSLLAA
jgi:hypothetical protein